MTPLNAMKQALSDIEDWNIEGELSETLANLRTAIAEMEKAEPVAWVIVTNNKNVPDRHDSWLTFDIAEFKHNSAPCLTIAEVTPLYSQQSDMVNGKGVAAAIRALKGGK